MKHITGEGSIQRNSMTKVDDQQDDWFNGEELIIFLQELLEGERAGARIARETFQQAEQLGMSGRFMTLINHIKSDEISYCSMLMLQIRRLGGRPGTNTGSFYAKCMAYDNLYARLDFLNRGQKWVVNRINEILGQLIDVELIEHLTEMRDTHQLNIDKTTALLNVNV